MQLRLVAAVIVFVGSYLPLSAILLVQDFDGALYSSSMCWSVADEGGQCAIPFGHPAVSLGSLLACAACFAATLLVLRRVEAKRSIVVERAKHVPSELMSYALPYVVAFINVDYEANKLAGLAIFLGWLFWITYRSGQIVLNPFLVAFGWRLYEVTYRFPDGANEHSGKALCDGSVSAGDRCRHTTIDDIVIVRTKETGGGVGHIG